MRNGVSPRAGCKASDIPSRKERKTTGMLYKFDPMQREQNVGDRELERVETAYKHVSPELGSKTRG